MERIADNIAKVRARIQHAANENGRPEKDIRLLAVSKTHPAEQIRQAYAAGLVDFGENYLQEAEAKMAELGDLPLVWHFIGPLQSNKTAFVARHFAWFHALDRLKIAERLGQQRPPNQPPLNVCIQVNIDNEPTKSGIKPADAPAFVHKVAQIPGLALRGLMAIPDPGHSRDQLKCSFQAMRQLFAGLQQERPDLSLDTLSMGMSADLELAIAAGSTLVRIGTDIFGPRT